MKNRIFALAAVLISSTACNVDDNISGLPPIRMYNSYIEGYYDIEKLSVRTGLFFTVNEADKIIDVCDISKYDKNQTSYRISDGIVLPMSLSSNWISETGDETTRIRYEALRDELGDNSFNRKLMQPYLPSALTGMIDGIRIYANEDYAPGYLTNADISGLFTIFYEHPYAVILNNYQSPENTYRYQFAFSQIPQAVYKESLSAVDLRGKKALGAEFYFLLNGAPAKTGEYSFTVEVKTADGRTLTATTKPIPIRVP